MLNVDSHFGFYQDIMIVWKSTRIDIIILLHIMISFWGKGCANAHSFFRVHFFNATDYRIHNLCIIYPPLNRFHICIITGISLSLYALYQFVICCFKEGERNGKGICQAVLSIKGMAINKG